MAILLWLLACGDPSAPPSGPPADPAPPAEEPVVTRESEEALAPIPFTAQQIHDAMPVGREIRWSLAAEGNTSTSVWRVRGQSDTALTLESGVPGGPFETATTPWTELRQHAAFPAADTVRSENIRVETALGILTTTRYVVSRTNAASEAELHSFWFAADYPGPPVRHTVVRGGAVIFEMEQVERTDGDPARWDGAP